MTTRPLYPHGRASAPNWQPTSEHPGRPDYDLIAYLRAAREEGDEAMKAAEQYDPDFSVKLSTCADGADAEKLLGEWLVRRLDVLKRTQRRLREVWQSAHH